MVDATDDLDQVFEGQLRVVLTVAGQIGERLAREREQRMRDAQAKSEAEQRRLESRIEAEHAASRVEMANVHRAEWWDRASPEDIGHAAQVIGAWSREDPEAARAENKLREEVRERWGIDVNDAQANPEAVRQLLRLELERAERASGGQESGLNEKAAAPESVGGVSYDSHARREVLASELEGQGISREVVATRVRADASQAKPASEALQGAPVQAAGRQIGAGASKNLGLSR